MTQQRRTPSPAEARELLSEAESVGVLATSTAGWPAATVLTSLAIIGSLMMVGLHIVTHTGYGAALLATSVGVWAAITACSWVFIRHTTTIGFSRRFAGSLLAYFGLYVGVTTVGVVVFPAGNLVFYVAAAVALAATGVTAAVRELQA